MTRSPRIRAADADQPRTGVLCRPAGQAAKAQPAAATTSMPRCRAASSITEGKSEVIGEVAVVPPYVTAQRRKRTSLDHLPGDRAGNGRARGAGCLERADFRDADRRSIAQRIRAAYETLRRAATAWRLYHRRIRPAGSLARSCRTATSISASGDRRFEAQRFLREQDDGGRLRGIGQPVAVAVPASVQGADRRIVSRLPRLETGAASAAFRQRGHQPGAPRAGYRLSPTRPISAIRSAGSTDCSRARSSRARGISRSTAAIRACSTTPASVRGGRNRGSGSGR